MASLPSRLGSQLRSQSPRAYATPYAPDTHHLAAAASTVHTTPPPSVSPRTVHHSVSYPIHPSPSSRALPARRGVPRARSPLCPISSFLPGGRGTALVGGLWVIYRGLELGLGLLVSAGRRCWLPSLFKVHQTRDQQASLALCVRRGRRQSREVRLDFLSLLSLLCLTSHALPPCHFPGLVSSSIDNG